jgi:tetratricopeptide (TPR) repeat protein
VAYSAAAVHPDNRLLVAAVHLGGEYHGLDFWDLATGDRLAFLPGVITYSMYFEPAPSGALVTIGLHGAFRWPIRTDAAQGRMTLGPPQRLPLPPGNMVSASRDGQVLASAARAVGHQQPHAGGWILHTDRPTTALRLEPKEDVDYAAVHPDGRWVATLEHSGVVKVWETADSRLVRQLARGASGPPQFSADGRWLAVSSDKGGAYAVGSWEVGARFQGLGVFSPDSKSLAVADWARTLRLLATDTGSELARLQDPNLDAAGSVAFSPDGTRLITTARDKSQGVHVWDLAALRARLKEMDLDWDAADYPAASREALPLRLEVRGAEWFLHASRASEHLEKQRSLEAAAELEKALALTPKLDWAAHELARLHVLGPATLRDAGKAVALAERAVKASPNDATYKSTLGMAYYRAGRWQAARDMLEASQRASLGWLAAHDLSFLAMCHHRLGDRAKAKACQARATEWVRERQERLPADWAAELRELQAEAEALLRSP